MSKKVKHELENAIIRLKSIISLAEEGDEAFTLDELLEAGDGSIDLIQKSWKDYKEFKRDIPSQ